MPTGGIYQHILRHIFDRYSKMSATLFLINRQIYVFFIFDYLSNSSKPSDCCRKISVHKMASFNELKNELSSVVNSTVSNLKRNRTEAMLDKELLKRRSHKRTTYPGQQKIGGSIHVYNDVGDKVRTTKVKTVQSQHKQTQPVKKRPPSNPQSEREGTINMHSHGHTLELPFAAAVLDW